MWPSQLPRTREEGRKTWPQFSLLDSGLFLSPSLHKTSLKGVHVPVLKAPGRRPSCPTFQISKPSPKPQVQWGTNDMPQESARASTAPKPLHVHRGGEKTSRLSGWSWKGEDKLSSFSFCQDSRAREQHNSHDEVSFAISGVRKSWQHSSHASSTVGWGEEFSLGSLASLANSRTAPWIPRKTFIVWRAKWQHLQTLSKQSFHSTCVNLPGTIKKQLLWTSSCMLLPPLG